MKKYLELHNKLTKSIGKHIFKDIKKEISDKNKNSMILTGYTILFVVFSFIFIYLLYKSSLWSIISYSSEDTLMKLQMIFATCGLSLFISIFIYGYLFYGFSIVRVLFFNFKISTNYIFRSGILFLLIFIITIIFLIINYIFDPNLVFLNEMISHIDKVLYGYVIIMIVSSLFFLIELLYCSRHDYYSLIIAFVLTMSPQFCNKILSKDNKQKIVKSFNDINEKDLKEFRYYLIYGNKVQNWIISIGYATATIYIASQLLIGEYGLSTTGIFDYVIQKPVFSIGFIFLILFAIFAYKVLITPNFVKGAYFIYLNNKN